jgi:hypothetical protein
MIGTYQHFTDLGEGNITGLDVLSHNRKIIMEIKNRHNTDNTSARKTNIDKLMKFKDEHPDYTCIYGVINDKKSKKYLYNDKVLYCSGDLLLELVFGSDKDEILLFAQDLITRELSCNVV